MAQQENHSTHWVLGGALLLIGLFVIVALVMIRSQAQDITASVNNAAPTISGGTAKLCPGNTSSDNASISGCTDISSLTLIAGTTTSVSYVVQVADDNGTDDINAAATGVFYHSVNGGSASCTADNNDCYRDDESCFKIEPTIDSTTAWYRCDHTVEYYTDPTPGAENWVHSLEVTDVGTSSDTDTTYTTEIAELVAGTFPTVAYGTVALGFSSATGTNQDVTHDNNGNVILDITVALDDTDTNAAVDCSTGTIPVANFDFNTDNGGGGDTGFGGTGVTALATSAQDLNIDVAQRTNDSSAQGPNNPFVSGDDIAYSYWNISVPSSGVLGSCQEELNVTFKQSP